MKILILSGPQGSGKTTLQQRITEKWYERYHRGTTIVNFADPIRKMADACNFILKDYGWPDRKITKDGPLMQLLGTEWGRGTIDDEIWVKLLRMKIERAIQLGSYVDGKTLTEHVDNSLVIIGDCRFPNEFTAFPEALRVRLCAPADVRKGRCEMWRDNVAHASEVALDGYDREGMFDMYLDTANTTIEGCISLLMVALAKGDWAERRKS